MRWRAVILGVALAAPAGGCLDASQGDHLASDAALKEGDARVVSDAGMCDGVFADEFERTAIGDDWQYYGGTTEFVQRGADGDRLFVQSTGGLDPKNPNHYAFGMVHTLEGFAIATHTIAVDIEAQPGESGDVFFGWHDSGRYLGMQALSNGSMTVVAGVLGDLQTVYCSGCVNFDPAARYWRVRPAEEELVFEISTDQAVWTRLTGVDVGDLTFADGTLAVWAECNATFNAGLWVDSAVVAVCPP